jgi:dipeptidase D
MTLVNDRTVKHPPLELLFTVEEEAGLIGARALKPGFIKGKKLINVDSEGEGVLTIGSAGGTVSRIILSTSTKLLPKDYLTYKLEVSGLQGGHSGLDINKHTGNANKIIARALDVLNSSGEIRVVSIQGGTRVNAIPREAEALVAFAPSQLPTFQNFISEFEQSVQKDYGSKENSLSITFSSEKEKKARSAITQKDSEKVIRLLVDLPDGVAEMSSDGEGQVETSNNIGVVELKQKSLSVLSFQRSSSMSKLDELTSRIETTAAGVGAKTKTLDRFSAWEPSMGSPLLKRCKQVYITVFGKKPGVQVIHAGLECSVIVSKYPGTDMIALGPTILNAHSPDEKLYIPSAERVYKFLAKLLESYGK